jgi:hypothetical protein
MKLIVTGYAEHGKDTVCELIEKIYDLTFVSSSWYAVMFTDMFTALAKEKGLTKQELYYSRGLYREEFFEIIKATNEALGLDYLGRGIFSKYDVYNGIRNHEEFFFNKEKKLFDLSIWVDASKRKPVENTGSCTMKPEYCDIVLYNNGTKEQLAESIITMMKSLKAQYYSI